MARVKCNPEKTLSTEAKPRLTIYFKGLQYLCHTLSNICYLFDYIECSLLSFCLCKIMCYPSEFFFNYINFNYSVSYYKKKKKKGQYKYPFVCST